MTQPSTFMKKKPVKEQPKSVVDLKCPRCGKVTHHYLDPKTGEYRCVICQSVNKTIKVAPAKDIEFVADPELEDALNPTPEVEK